MLTSLFCFTQVNYPKLVISDGDSLVLQTLEQTRYVSKQLEIGKACYLSGIQKDSIISRMGINEKYLNEVNVIKNEIIASKDSTISDKDTIIDSYKKINDNLIKENKDLRTKNTITLIGCGILTTIITILAFL